MELAWYVFNINPTRIIPKNYIIEDIGLKVKEDKVDGISRNAKYYGKIKKSCAIRVVFY